MHLQSSRDPASSPFLGLGLRLELRELLALSVMELVSLEDPDSLSVEVGLVVVLLDKEGLGLPLAELLGEAPVVRLEVGDSDFDTVPEPEMLLVGDWLRDAEGVLESLELLDPEELREEVPEPDAELL